MSDDNAYKDYSISLILKFTGDPSQANLNNL